MKQTHLPLLLDNKMQVVAVLHPIRLTVEAALSPPSSAEMVLAPDAPTVNVRDFIRIWDGFHDSAVYRVSSVTQEIGLRQTIQLEHAVMTLADDMLPSLTYSENVKTIFRRLLSYQTRIRWEAGDVDVDDDLMLSAIAPSQTIFSALTSLLDMLPQEYCLSFDQSVWPWRLNLNRLSSQVANEGRLKRNLSSVRITQDTSQLCTRVFPYGCGQGLNRISLRTLLGRDYLDSPDVRTWGVAARSFTSDQITDAQTLKSVAERYLERHSQPTATIQLQGVDLSRITGESLDAFRLGQLFRLALPDSAIFMQERIVAMRIPDVFGEPGLVTLTLANRQPALSDEIANLLRDVNVGKLSGSRMSDLIFRSRTGEGIADDNATHYFWLDEYPSLLSCQVLLSSDESNHIATLDIDGNTVPETVWRTLRFEALPYLRKNENGTVATGQHYLLFTLQDAVEYISSTITVKVVEKSA